MSNQNNRPQGLFSPENLSPKPAALFENQNQGVEPNAPRPLFFESKNPNNIIQATSVQSLFEPDSPTPIQSTPVETIISASSSDKPTFLFNEGKISELMILREWCLNQQPQLNARHLEFIEQLSIDILPLQIQSLSRWGEKILAQSQNIASKIASFGENIRAQLADQLLNQVTESLQNTSSGFKFFGKNKSPIEYKEALEQLIQTSQNTLIQIDLLTPDISNIQEQLTLCLLILKGCIEVFKPQPLIEELLWNKTQLFQGAATNSHMFEPHTLEVQRTTLRWQQEAERILQISIPAWELAHRK